MIHQGLHGWTVYLSILFSSLAVVYSVIKLCCLYAKWWNNGSLILDFVCLWTVFCSLLVQNQKTIMEPTPAENVDIAHLDLQVTQVGPVHWIVLIATTHLPEEQDTRKASGRKLVQDLWVEQFYENGERLENQIICQNKGPEMHTKKLLVHTEIQFTKISSILWFLL